MESSVRPHSIVLQTVHCRKWADAGEVKGCQVVERNKEIIRRYFAAWADPDVEQALAALDDIVHPDFVDHAAYEGQPTGIDGVRDFWRKWRSAFPDFTVQVHDTIAEGDRVVTRWRMDGTHLGEYDGFAPTGKRIGHSAISIDRIENELIVEEWIEFDLHGLMQQLRVNAAD
jgi:steroid delta-isomerase-like uncharacterized protein